MLLLLVQEGLRPSADLVCDIYTRYVMRCDVVVLNCFYFLVSLSSLSSPSSPSSPSTATIAMVCYFWRDWCAISGEIGVLFLARLVCYFRRDWCAISSEKIKRKRKQKSPSNPLLMRAICAIHSTLKVVIDETR